jgi:hypothetical protein
MTRSSRQIATFRAGPARGWDGGPASREVRAVDSARHPGVGTTFHRAGGVDALRAAIHAGEQCRVDLGNPRACDRLDGGGATERTRHG